MTNLITPLAWHIEACGAALCYVQGRSPLQLNTHITRISACMQTHIPFNSFLPHLLSDLNDDMRMQISHASLGRGGTRY